MTQGETQPDTIIANVRSLVGALRADLDARYLAMAFLVPVFEVFRRVSFSLPLALADAASPYACVACVALGFLLAAVVAFVRGAHARPLPPVRPTAGAMALAAGAALAMLPAVLGAPPACAGILGAAGYALLGACLALLVIGWVGALTAAGALAGLLHTAGALMLGGLAMSLVIAAESAPVLWAMLFGCLLASAGVLAWICARPRAPHAAARPQAGVPGGAEGAGADMPPVRQLMRQGLDAPALGLALTMFSWGVMAVPPMPYLNDHKWWVYVVGEAIALVVICVLVYALRNGSRYGELRQKMFFLLPVFAVFLSYFSFIRMLDADGGLKDFLSVGFNMSVPGFFALFLASAAARCREKGISAECAAAPGLVACTLLYALGAALFEVFGNAAMYFQIVFTTLYILGLAFIATRQASLNDESRLEARCGGVAARCGLSQREAEVLRLVVAGYSVARIAEELTISPETVRTHKKRIYAKLDVHAHDELIRRVRTGR